MNVSLPRDLPEPPYLSQWGNLACNEALLVRDEDPAPLHDWRADGYLSAEDYRWWSRQTCGLTCLLMILGMAPTRWPRVPRKAALLADAVAHGVLTPHDDGTVGGLYYAPFVKWVGRAFGLEAVSRPELPLAELAERVASGAWLAMTSVSHEIRLPDEPPTHTGGHLVLVHRVECAGAGGATGGSGKLGGDGETVGDGETGDDPADDRPGPACTIPGGGVVERLVFHNPSGLPAAPGRPGTAADAAYAPAVFARFYAGRGILVRRP